MNKGRVIVFIIVLIIAIPAFWFAINSLNVKKHNWSETFRFEGKEPFDFSLLKSTLENSYGKDFIYIKDKKGLEEAINFKETNQLYAKWTSNFNLEDSFYIRLIEWISIGNHAFISSKTFDQNFISLIKHHTYDSNSSSRLKYISFNYYQSRSHYERVVYDTQFYFKVKIRNEEPSNYAWNYITLDLADNGHSPLAVDEKNDITCIQLRIGNGTLTMHVNPIVFTNLLLKEENGANYFYKLWKNISGDKIYLDVSKDYYHGKSPQPKNNKSVLQFINSQPSLLFASLILLTGLVLFLVLASKRKSSPIEDQQNSSNTIIKFIKYLSPKYNKKKNIDLLLGIDIKNFEYWSLQKYRVNYKFDDKSAQQLAKMSQIDINKLIEINNLVRAYTKNADANNTEFIISKLQSLYNKQ